MDVELGEAVHALQLLEPVERDLARACHELEQLGLLFLVEAADRAPEPLDLWRRGLVVVILRIILPIVDVDVRQTRNEELKLLLVEYGDELRGNDIVESCGFLSAVIVNAKENH